MHRALRLQGAYYAATGLWPLLHMRSFERITGPKHDRWLVRMVGLLAFCDGVVLLVGTRNDRVRPEAKLLSTLSAAAFASIDVYYAIRKTISPIYLADAAAEFGLILAAGS